MAFKLENQYTYLFEDFQINNGYDIFMRYQDKNTADEEREHLESVVKGWILDKNHEVARLTYSDDYMLYNVNSLMSLSTSDIYSNGEFGVNSVGVSVLQTFFPELEGVDKVKGCCMRDFCKKSEKSFTRYVRKLLKYGKSPNDMRSMFAFVGAGYCSNFRPLQLLKQFMSCMEKKTVRY